MDFYTPLFGKIVDSSLWDEDDMVVKVFLTMLAKKDMDDIVRGTAYNISKWSRKTEAEVLRALKVLSSPDTRRIEKQPNEGRRIEKVEGGWFIINGEYYRKLMQEANRREYQRRKQAEYRQKKAKESGREPYDNRTGERGLKDVTEYGDNGTPMNPAF